MIYSDNTYDITNNIATYTRRDFKSVFVTTFNKWYMLNNLNEYEEYGIYGDSFDTYYQGKLVIVNGHEYEWDGTEWDDLGPNVEVVSSVYRDAEHTGYITFPLTSLDVASFEATLKVNSTDGNSFLIGILQSDNNDWRVFGAFPSGNSLYYDCGNDRYYSPSLYNVKKHLRFDGNPMRLYDYDSQSYLYTGSGSRPTNKSMYFGYSDNGFSTDDYGYLYDLVFYSDNGETAIAHYIPYIQNGVAGLYDTMSNTFLAPTGVLGAESEQSIPKEYTPKAAPTITNVWPSKWYHNSTYMYKLMRNDAEQIIVAYMSDDKVRKGKYVVPVLPLHFIAEQNANIALNIGNLEYSKNSLDNWQAYTQNSSLSLSAGDTIYFRGENTTIYQNINSTNDALVKISGGDVGSYGRVSSLYSKSYDNDVVISNPTFENSENSNQELSGFMFNQSKLTHGPSFKGLSFTKNEGSYGRALDRAFKNCSKLSAFDDAYVFEFMNNSYLGRDVFLGTAIQGKASFNLKGNDTITIYNREQNYGCTYMFKNCTSLTDVSWINVDITTWQGGLDMFNGCSNLIYGPTIISTGGNSYTNAGMFYNCSSLLTLTITDNVWSGGRQDWLGGVTANNLTIYKNSMLPEEYASNKLLTGCTVQNI